MDLFWNLQFREIHFVHILDFIFVLLVEGVE